MAGFPVKISVRVLFSDGTEHEYDVDNLAALTQPQGETRAVPALPLTAWTPYQRMLAELYGVCEKCGGPRDVKVIEDGSTPSRFATMYCPACAARR